MKGSYTLLIELKKDRNIKVGALGKVHFPKGHFVYVGSALNGIEGRVRRHLRDEKKMHWHIDYFLKKAQIKDVYYLESNKKSECKIAKKFKSEFNVVPRFGSSDCQCDGHLFYWRKRELESAVKECGFERLILDYS